MNLHQNTANIQGVKTPLEPLLLSKQLSKRRFKNSTPECPLLSKLNSPCLPPLFMAWFTSLFLSLFLFSTTIYATNSITSTEQNINSTATQMTQVAVGHIQFVIGRHVQVIRQQKIIEAKIGAPLYQSDALVTGTNSFIHVKMVDDALISIRPQSHLEINCYQNAVEPGKRCLKFTLLKGQVRKVSGKAGKESPQKYRLNTPVAAIGIRGTDYIASVQGNTSLVKVMQGAISVSPFIEGCTVQGFGECHTSYTALLTEHDPYMLRILSEQMPEPITADLQAYSVSYAKASNTNKAINKEDKPAANKEEAKQEAGDESKAENTEKPTASQENQQSGQQPNNEHLASNDQPAPTENTVMSTESPILKDNDDLIAQFIQQANSSMEVQLSEDGFKKTVPTMPVVKQQADLVFGTWSPYSDGISIPYNQAKQGRNITIGGVEGALWRSEGTYRPPEGRVDYNLTDSHAYVMNVGQVTSAEVVSGSMNIDFDQKLLSTKMTIEPTNMRSVVYSASHNLTRSDGIFANNTAAGRVGEGAISNDGSQVGYRLRQPVERGTLHVDTLWRATQPN